MKKLIGIVFLFVVMLSNAKAQATTPASEASQVAQKMMDSLLLSDPQRSQIEAATLDIQTMKARLRQLYTSRALDYYLFMAEESRDSVYKNILPADKYLLFKQKKNNLLNNY